MVKFKNLQKEDPYIMFKDRYDTALKSGQKNIEAMVISSYDTNCMEVNSRCVNLKFIDGNKFIFFSNYNSPKSIAFRSHQQISALFYWPSTNNQIRIKAKINRTSDDYNRQYFKKRSKNKNALAISSNQSQRIKSYDYVVKKYNEVKNTHDLQKCPDFWGGFSFIPYYFEFWEGNDSRLNRRDVYKMINGKWENFIIEP